MYTTYIYIVYAEVPLITCGCTGPDIPPTDMDIFHRSQLLKGRLHLSCKPNQPPVQRRTGGGTLMRLLLDTHCPLYIVLIHPCSTIVGV